MLNYRFVQILQRIVLSYLSLCIVAACSTVPNNYSDTVSAKSQIKNSNETLGDFIVQSAKSQLGARYKYGGESPSEGFDCSGLVLYSHHLNGIKLPRTAAAQFQQGEHIKRTELNSGDLLFFKTMGHRVSHVGIYMGNNLFIHSPNSRKNVQTETLANPYYKKHYIGARRYW